MIRVSQGRAPSLITVREREARRCSDQFTSGLKAAAYITGPKNYQTSVRALRPSTILTTDLFPMQSYHGALPRSGSSLHSFRS